MFRKNPDVSPREEGAQEAEMMLADIMAGGYDWRGYDSPEAAVQGYLALAEGVKPVDAEHADLLAGYLDTFRRR